MTKPPLPTQTQFRLDRLFRSDSLVVIREFLARNPELWFLVKGRILQIYAIVDANVVQAELRWRLGKRENPQARSGLEESLDAGTLVLIAPNFLRVEIQKYLAEIAEETHRTLPEAEEEWKLFAAKLRFYQPSSTVPTGEVVDPKDLPYKIASDELGLPVYTRDAHLDRMNAPVLSLCIDLACRDHARASGVTLGVTMGSGVSVTVGIKALCEAVKGIRILFEGFRRLPVWVQAGIAGAITLAAAHPKSRAKITQLCGSAWGLASEMKEPLFKVLMAVMEQLAAAQLEGKRTRNEIQAALPQTKKATALLFAKRICVACGEPTSIGEIAHRMRIAGYVSRAKDFESYLRRVLRASRQFVEVSPGLWQLGQS